MASAVAGILFVGTLPREGVQLRRVRGLVALVAVLAALWTTAVLPSIQPGPRPVKRGDVDVIATFLSQRLRPSDTVQPLDVASGAVHAMLITKSLIATPFIYDFHFYHHQKRPIIRDLRGRMLAAIKKWKSAVTPR